MPSGGAANPKGGAAPDEALVDRSNSRCMARFFRDGGRVAVVGRAQGSGETKTLRFGCSLLRQVEADTGLAVALLAAGASSVQCQRGVDATKYAVRRQQWCRYLHRGRHGEQSRRLPIH